MHVLSVAKSYKHRGGGHVHRRRTKRQWQIYYITDEGGFGSKLINPLMVPFYRSKVERYKLMECPACLGLYTAFYKKPEELEGIPCPACSYFTMDNEDDADDD